jgi:hypothetical protein
MTKRQLADDLVVRFNALRDPMGPSGKAHIQWDDCNMTEDTFWFMFEQPTLYDVRVARSPVMQSMQQLVRSCSAVVRRESKTNPRYSLEWHRTTWPRATYWCDRQFYKYDLTHWMYKLTIYG